MHLMKLLILRGWISNDEFTRVFSVRFYNKLFPEVNLKLRVLLTFALLDGEVEATDSNLTFLVALDETFVAL